MCIGFHHNGDCGICNKLIYIVQKENEELKQEIISQQFLLDITIFEAQILIDERGE